MKNKKYVIINSLISFALIILISINIFCSYFQNESVLCEKNLVKTLEIKTSQDNELWNYATGFFIDDEGTILTNKHVVFDSKSNSVYKYIKVRLCNRDVWNDAELKKISDNNDLAIVKAEFNDTKYFKLAKNYKNGQKIYTIGNPNGFGLSFISGNISSKNRKVIYNKNTINTIQTSFVINEGNSGGPVFNNRGKLIGIISFRLKGKNGEALNGVTFILPIETISEFI